MAVKPALVILSGKEEFSEKKSKILQLFPSSEFASVLRAHNLDIARRLIDRCGDALLYVEPYLYMSKHEAQEALNILRRVQ